MWLYRRLRENGPWLLGCLDLGKYFTDEFMVSAIGFKPYWIQHYQFLNYGPYITFKKEVKTLVWGFAVTANILFFFSLQSERLTDISDRGHACMMHVMSFINKGGSHHI